MNWIYKPNNWLIDYRGSLCYHFHIAWPVVNLYSLISVPAVPRNLTFEAWRPSVVYNCSFNSCNWFFREIDWKQFLGSLGKCHNCLVLVGETLVLTDRTCPGWNSEDRQSKFLNILQVVIRVTYWECSMENCEGVLDYFEIHNCSLVRCQLNEGSWGYFTSFVDVDRRVYQIYDRSLMLTVSCKLKINE